MKRGVAAGALLAGVLGVTVVVIWLNLRGEAAVSDAPAAPPAAAASARGAVLATLGHCSGCHTAPGGPAYAGGVGITTPWGTVYAGNLTPDAQTGLGRWNADHFWRAMHHGRSRDGRLLNPAFPYPNFTRLTRADSDALFDFLRSLPPVHQPGRASALRWPFGSQGALAVWRALYFRAGSFVPDPAQPAAWNRGAYLVHGLGHCGACHAPRNALGAARAAEDLGGATMPGGRWFAPSLHGGAAADLVALLRDGRSAQGVALGPMARVVAGSTQHWPADDLQAVAAYLSALPPRQPARVATEPAPAAMLAEGARLYEAHCADCHGKVREGVPGVYPALRSHPTVTLDPPNNLIRIIVEGGFAAATAAHARPYGMPPFGHQLDDGQIAALASWLREGSGAGAVLPLAVRGVR